MKHRNKYYAKKTNCAQGHTHGSKKEANRCNELSDMQRRGEISCLEQQPQFWFAINDRPLTHANGHRVGYKADFRYCVAGGKVVVEEVKGFTVRDWPLRRAVFLALFPDITFREI